MCCSRSLYDSSPSSLCTCVRTIHVPWRPCRLSFTSTAAFCRGILPQCTRELHYLGARTHCNAISATADAVVVFQMCDLNMHARCENHNASFRACAFAAHTVPMHWLTKRLQLCYMLHVVGDGDKHKTECRVMPCISACCSRSHNICREGRHSSPPMGIMIPTDIQSAPSMKLYTEYMYI